MTDQDRTIPWETIDRMVRSIDRDRRVRRAAPAPGGFLPVYHLSVDAAGGTAERVLKVGRGEGAVGVAVEARVLGILREHTSIPVPRVFGAVDHHDTLPSPFFLMEAVAGTAHPRTELDRLSKDTVRRIARSTGTHLASLHAVDAVDAFGTLEPDPSRPLQGGRPTTDTGQLRVADPIASWPTYVKRSVEDPLDRLADGRFADLVPAVRSALHRRIDALSGTFRPVLGHIDNSIENVLVDPETDEITAMLDWAFTLAVTAGYDLAFVEHSLSGGPWWFVPDFPDYQKLIREALLRGYRENGREAAVREFHDHHRLYRLLRCTHSLLHFEDRLARDGASAEQIQGAREAHRAVIADLV